MNYQSKSRFTVLNLNLKILNFFFLSFFKTEQKNCEIFLFKIQKSTILQSLKPNSLALALYLYFNLYPLQAKLFTEQMFISQ